MTDPASEDEPTWTREVPSEIHGALEHLRFTVRQHTGDPNVGGEAWSAVYARIPLQPSPEVIERAAHAAVENGAADPVTVMRDVLTQVFSDRINAMTAARTAVTLALLDWLREATGKPLGELLDDLDRWAAQRDDH